MSYMFVITQTSRSFRHCTSLWPLLYFTGNGRMSVTVAKTNGVTVFTLTSDPESPCPPLCQILKGLCYSPPCYSVSELLRKVQRTSQSLLGVSYNLVLEDALWAIKFGLNEDDNVLYYHTAFPPPQALHIMVGLLNIGLGVCLYSRSSPYPFWLGGMVSTCFNRACVHVKCLQKRVGF